ncbi:hypothetical protein HNR16_002112 [Pseudoclavibacter chungangensis]|nr:hypothetical protein [Pseudoclavibacter chungangensis]NYJ67324.1 hypothetical protein [Pseudoclavibacter chungangensis]
MIRFDDARDLADLATFLGRAARVEEGAVRLQAAGEALAVWVPVLRPQTILDDSPVVIGLRVMRASVDGAPDTDAPDGQIDVTVPVRAVLDRLARVGDEARTILVPPDRVREAWAAVSPPRGGWRRIAEVDSTELARVAETGIDDVAKAVPSELGTALVERVRTETWTRPLPGTGLDDDDAPVAGVAFAAHALGFLVEPEPVALSASAGWLRLSLRRGHVLSRARRVERLAHPSHG